MKAVIASLFTLCCSCLAHNNLFFPGDAFFSTTFRKSAVITEQSESLEFDYKRLSSRFMLCGYIGFYQLQVEDLPEKTRKNLIQFRERLFNEFAEFATVSEEENDEIGKTQKVYSFPVLIYNKDFDFDRCPIGLRLNEDWVSIQTEEAKRGHAIYDGPMARNLVVVDWHDSSAIRGLDCKLDRTELKQFMGSEKPVVADGGDIVFVVPIGLSIWEVAENKKGTRFFVIGEEIREFRLTEKGLEQR